MPGTVCLDGFPFCVLLNTSPPLPEAPTACPVWTCSNRKVRGAGHQVPFPCPDGRRTEAVVAEPDFVTETQFSNLTFTGTVGWLQAERAPPLCHQCCETGTRGMGVPGVLRGHCAQGTVLSVGDTARQRRRQML